VKLVSGWAAQFKPEESISKSEKEPSEEQAAVSPVPAAKHTVSEPPSSTQEQTARPSDEEKPASAELSDFIKELIAPVSESNPCGEDPKYLSEFDVVKSEIEKSGGTNYELVAKHCRTLLTTHTKDLRVLGYYLLATAKTTGTEQFCELVVVYNKLISDHFENIHPQRETARINAVKWLNQAKLHAFLGQLKVNSSNYGSIKKAQAALREIKDLANTHFPDSPPSIKSLIKIVDNWIKETEPKAVAVDPVTQPARISSPQPASPSAPAAGPLPSTPQEVADSSAARMLLQKTAQFYLKNEPSNPIGYKIMRIIKWQEIVKAPAAANGILRIQGPNPQMIEYYAKMTRDQNWQEIILKGEEAFTRPGMHFWLDLQYYLVQALEGAGGGYTACAGAILDELTSLVERVPELLNFKYQDNVPFASAATADWIQQNVNERKSGGSGEAGHALDEQLKEDKQAALELAQKGKLEEALALLQERNRAGNTKSVAQRRLLMVDICFRAGNFAMAEGLIEDIIAKISGNSLEEWDPGFCMTVYNTGIKVFRSLAENKAHPEQVRTGFLMKARDCFKSLSRLDPVEAAKMNFN
jgi:type VI secretion system protein VasJ